MPKLHLDEVTQRIVQLSSTGTLGALDQTPLKEQINALRAEVTGLKERAADDAVFKEKIRWEILKKEARVAQQEQLMRHDRTRVFYNTVHRKLTQIFLALMTLDSGLVEGTEDNTDLMANTISILGSAIPIPLLDKAATLLSGGIKHYHKNKKENQIKQVTKELVGLSDIDRIAGGASRKLTLRFREQILDMIRDEDAEKLGEYAACIMLNHILTAEFEGYLNDELVDAVTYQRSRKCSFTDKIKEMFPEFLKKLTTIEVTSKHIGLQPPQYFFTKAGLKTLELETEYYAGKGTDPAMFGFRTCSRKCAKERGYRLLAERGVTEIPAQSILKQDHVQNTHSFVVYQLEVERRKNLGLEERVRVLESGFKFLKSFHPPEGPVLVLQFDDESSQRQLTH